MACEHPRRIINRRYVDMTATDLIEYSELNFGMRFPPDYWLEVPCGYCHSCQKSENNQYRIRLMYEIRDYPNESCLFVTLTFDDENLARFGKDPNKAVRLFLDRLRKQYGKQIRHWFIGEYGTLHGRPHYHGILFGVPEELRVTYLVDSVVPDPKDPDKFVFVHAGDHPLISAAWKYGFVFVGYVSDETCGYITKYLTKSLNDKKRRPRVITSFGIGSSYLKSDEAVLHKQPGKYQTTMTLNGFPQAMPRYYYNKIFTDVDKQNIALERYLCPPPFSWQGVEYPSKEKRDRARSVTFEQNKNLGLTPLEPPLTRKNQSSLERFKNLMLNFETEFAL